jgi:hypothetical protein
MSEYQYYEFQALDRPLGEADRKALRALSSRARITSTSFTNSYEWGDFKGSPEDLMKRWFDLHLYVSNWGTRRLMLRFPKRLVDQRRLETFLREVDCAEITISGENLVLDILRDELDPEDHGEDGSAWLASLAPLRSDVLAGDLRLFYLLWLIGVENDEVPEDTQEPLSGIGPSSGALETFATFFRIDPDLVAAACERSSGMPAAAPLALDTIQRIVTGLPHREKDELLVRLASGDPHVAGELRLYLQGRSQPRTSAIPPPLKPRTASELRARAEAMREARKREHNERLLAEQKRREAEEKRSRRIRLDAMQRRGEIIWREVEAEIERRNPTGYDKAAFLLLDLKTLAGEHGTEADFRSRLGAIRERHARKERFIARLKDLG